ncbi:DUF4245 domain-containing protein [Streptomyces gamaensis]|uniref:DUF4245 domain-containing protein n=1 Tax=Streptomyces gamaensis TaxID=1763542 RepID=A0ABW0YVR0_9ACTN
MTLSVYCHNEQATPRMSGVKRVVPPVRTGVKIGAVMGDDGGVAGRNGKKQTVRNMVLSLVAVIPVAFVSWFFIPHGSGGGNPAKTVDYRVELQTARRAAPYPVAAPEGLGEGWRATSRWYQPGGRNGSAWHLGFLDPQTEYVAVEQSDAPAAGFVDAVSQGAQKTDRTQEIGGVVWQRYEGTKYNALVREEPGVTTVVTGTASAERLAEMAGALKAEKATPVPAPGRS